MPGLRAKRLLMTLAVVCGWLTGSCRRADASGVTVDRDTLVLYGPRITRLPIRLTDRDGTSVPSHRATLAVADSALLRVTDSGIACTGTGGTRVHIRFRSSELMLPTVCRPARVFRGEPTLSLVVGDAPATLAFAAVLESGMEEAVRPVESHSADTAVARVEGSAVHAVAAGRTTLLIELGGASTGVQVSVSERIAFDSVAFVPGAFRQWALAPGRYSVTVRRSNARSGPLGFDVVTEGARCTPRARDGDTVYCAVADTGAVSLYSTARDPERATEYAWVTLYRLP